MRSPTASSQRAMLWLASRPCSICHWPCSPPWSGLSPRGSASFASPGPVSLILKYLPVSMLPKGQIFREDGGCETLEEVQSNRHLKVVSATSHSLHIEYHDFSRIIVEIMRADLNNGRVGMWRGGVSPDYASRLADVAQDIDSM